MRPKDICKYLKIKGAIKAKSDQRINAVKKTQNSLFYALGTIEHDVITDVVENHNRLKYLAQSDSSDIQFGGIPKCD